MKVDITLLKVHFHSMKSTLTTSDLFGSPGRIGVLRILWCVGAPMTAAEVARRASLSHPAASTILRSLVWQGIVASSPAGRGHVYWMPKDNIYVERFIDPVFSAEVEVPDLMLAELCSVLAPLTESAVLFGSYARGDQTAASDVDLAVVVEDAAARAPVDRALAVFAPEFERRFGATLSPLVYDRPEAAELADRAPALWQSILSEGVTACGIGPAEWRGQQTK